MTIIKTREIFLLKIFVIERKNIELWNEYKITRILN